VGDRLANLRAAAERLGDHPELELTGTSSVYETEAIDDAIGQRDFYNAVVEAETALGPRDLLSVCKEVERALGRDPAGRRHAPRPIDVDLLLLGDLRVDEEDLVIPHPGVTRRRFVLVPLLEVAPDLSLPGAGPLAAALAALGKGQRVTCVDHLKESSLLKEE
jgi:2-amino-4-hydroxy-6-hydroxymethyldihydropteridine diphosphokinase